MLKGNFAAVTAVNWVARMKQTTFSSPTYRWKSKRTRREIFFAATDRVVHWVELLD